MPIVDPSEPGCEPIGGAEVLTNCDLNVVNNVWVEGDVNLAAGKRGICMLDSLTAPQIIGILKHDPRAREDLPKVTSNPDLLQLLADTRLLPSVEMGDALQSRANRNPAAIPFYSVFRGRAPAARR